MNERQNLYFYDIFLVVTESTKSFVCVTVTIQSKNKGGLVNVSGVWCLVNLSGVWDYLLFKWWLNGV